MVSESKHFESLYPENVRDQEINRIVSYIQGGNSCQVIGVRGVGRATLLGFLAYNKAVRLKHFPTRHGVVHFVMANFSEVRNRPLFDVMKFLFLSLVTSLREREMMEEYEKVDRFFKDSLQYDDELVLTQGLKNAIDYLSIEKKLTIVLLFDRFEEYVPNLTSEFFTTLRSLRDRAKYRFSAVLSLSRPLEDSIEPALFSDYSDFIAGHYIYLPLYDESSVSFRVSYLEKLTKKMLSEAQNDEIITLTGGHMRLIKTSVEAVLAQAEEISDLKTFLLTQKTVQAALRGIWQSLTPSEQEALREEKSDDYLEKIGLIKEQKLQIPLLKEFLQSHTELQKVEKLIYDEQANIIKQGEIVFSDSLTKAEFRLLRHLLQNPERIIERDEVVNAVWKNLQSTLGVTEQAIDQLIFRLRRKIEADPNNPLHIQTVKGRGFKFTP